MELTSNPILLVLYSSPPNFMLANRELEGIAILVIDVTNTESPSTTC